MRFWCVKQGVRTILWFTVCICTYDEKCTKCCTYSLISLVFYLSFEKKKISVELKTLHIQIWILDKVIWRLNYRNKIKKVCRESRRKKKLWKLPGFDRISHHMANSEKVPVKCPAVWLISRWQNHSMLMTSTNIVAKYFIGNHDVYKTIQNPHKLNFPIAYGLQIERVIKIEKR